MSNVPPNPPSCGQHNHYADHKVESMKKRLQTRVFVPLLAELLADVRKAETPRERTGKCVNDKLLQVHARDACRKSNECANCRQQAADEHDDFAKPIEPTIGEIQIVPGYEYELSVLLN